MVTVSRTFIANKRKTKSITVVIFTSGIYSAATVLACLSGGEPAELPRTVDFMFISINQTTRQFGCAKT